MTTQVGEFELINHYFKSFSISRPDLILGIGDDAAIVEVPPEQQLVLAMDTIIAGRHFFKSAPPESVGYRALAVNLSDLAAMGAEPAWFTLALTLPSSEPEWLKGFAQGLESLAKTYQVACIGGDTTKGELSITIQAHGFVPRGRALTRAGANVDDLILVTETLGGPAYAIEQLHLGQAIDPQLEQFMLYPKPQIRAGLILRDFATSMIDISDGLAADLNHILEASQVGARIDCSKLPLHSALLNLPRADALRLALTGGDDYQLCFTVPSELLTTCQMRCSEAGIRTTVIGQMTSSQELQFYEADGQRVMLSHWGYQHFE